MLSDLMDREHWQVGPIFGGLMALPWLLVCLIVPGAVPGLFGGICFLFLLFGRFPVRTSVFEAALPISGRQVVLARVLTVLAYLWCPALAMIAGALIIQGWKATLPLLEMAAVFNLAALATQSSNLRKPNASAGLGFLALLCAGAAILVPSIFSHSAEVLGGSMAVSALLALRLWVSAPEGFQIASAKAGRIQATARRQRSLVGELLDLDPDLKVAPFLVLLQGVVFPFVCKGSHADSIATTFGIACLMIALTAPGERATEFQAALPIPGRKLVTVRMLSTFALCWLFGLALIGETWVMRGWKDALPLLEWAALATPLWLAVQSLEIHETHPPRWVRSWRIWLVLGPGFVYFESTQHLPNAPALFGVCLAASVALLVRLWFIVPEGFQTAAAKPVRPPRFAVRRPNWRGLWSPTWLPAWRPFLHGRIVSSLFFAWIPAMFGMSLVLGAGLVLPALSNLQRLEWLLVLPVSRRKLLPMMLLPWLCILIAVIPLTGYLVRAGEKAPTVCTGHSDVWQERAVAGAGTPNVLVSTIFWNWAWGGEAPVVQSPWGETTQPKTFRRLGFVFYNPYSVAPGNSERFLDWQFSRATEAVYGRAVRFSQSWELPKLGLIPVMRQLRTRCIEVLASALVFLGIFYLALWHRTGRCRAWAVVLWVGFVAPFLCDIFGTERVVRGGMLSDIVTLRLAAILPQSPAALVAIAALLLGGLYLAVEKQFEEVDLIPRIPGRMRPRRARGDRDREEDR